jgi:hypothetical protein
MDIDKKSYWRHVSVDDSDVLVTFQSKLFRGRQAKDARPDDDDLAIVVHS